MTARLIDGRRIGRQRNLALRDRIRALEFTPRLAVVLVGEDPASQVYVRRKETVALRLGFAHEQHTLPSTISQARLLAVVDQLNADPEVDGILVQLPLPAHLDTQEVIQRIDPRKDVDGLTWVNTGRLSQGQGVLRPCTPAGVMVLLESAGVELSGARAVVIGRSNIVGRPMAMMLEQAHATVTVCHSRTRDLPSLTRQADVLVVAMGRPEAVKADWIKPGAAVIDVGIHRSPSGGLVGDVSREVEAVAGCLTPVPGGVGPMTIAMLMENTYTAALARRGVLPKVVVS